MYISKYYINKSQQCQGNMSAQFFFKGILKKNLEECIIDDWPPILPGPTFYSALQALFEHWGATKVGQGLLTCEQTERFATTYMGH